MPAAFYAGTTGIDPVDHVIRAVLDTGYCHHIERLMILGNFMLLCDLAPGRGVPLVHGAVHRRLRLGDGAERVRHEPVRRRRGDDDQAVHQRQQLRAEDERLQEGPVVRGVGRPVLAVRRPARRLLPLQPADGGDGRNAGQDGDEADRAFTGR